MPQENPVGLKFYPATNGDGINTDLRLYEWGPSNGERVTFQAGGNVGIGTLDPLSRLHIMTPMPEDGLILDRESGVDMSSKIFFAQQAVPKFSMGTDLNVDNTKNFFIRDEDTSQSRFFINSTGSIGMGTTTPVAPLTVMGTGQSPSIPGVSSTGLLRLAISTNEGLDMGKISGSPYAAWIQSGYNGSTADPLALQPSGGFVGIGVTNPAYKLDVNGTIRGFGITDTSDVRFKKDIILLNESLDKILKIEGVSYYWKDTKHSRKQQIGLIAQEVEKQYPELVKLIQRE